MVNIINGSGSISITDEVFTNLAGDAATSCFGVKGMVTCGKDGGPWQLLRRESMSKGVVVVPSSLYPRTWRFAWPVRR